MTHEYEGFIIHHTAGVDTPDLEVDDVEDYHVTIRKYRDIGYHFFIENLDGRFYTVMARPLFMKGAHSKGENDTHIGIACHGNFSVRPPQHGMIVELASTIAGLSFIMKFAPETLSSRVIGHNEAPGADTVCPGMLNVDSVIELAMMFMGGINVAPFPPNVA